MDSSVDSAPSTPSVEDFQAELARLALGWRSDRHLPAIAMVGLEAGLDSKALAALAGEGEAGNAFGLRALFDKALRELDLSLPGREEAVDWLLLWWLRRLLARRCSVNEALRGLVDLHRETERKDSAYTGDALGIEGLLGIYWVIDDGLEAGYLKEADLRALEAEARELAQAYLVRFDGLTEPCSLGPR